MPISQRMLWVVAALSLLTGNFNSNRKQVKGCMHARRVDSCCGVLVRVSGNPYRLVVIPNSSAHAAELEKGLKLEAGTWLLKGLKLATGPWLLKGLKLATAPWLLKGLELAAWPWLLCLRILMESFSESAIGQLLRLVYFVLRHAHWRYILMYVHILLQSGLTEAIICTCWMGALVLIIYWQL